VRDSIIIIIIVIIIIIREKLRALDFKTRDATQLLCMVTTMLTYLLTYLLHGTESFLRN